MATTKNASIKDVILTENNIKVTFGKVGAISQYFDIDCCSCGSRFGGKLNTETLVENADGTRTVSYIGRVSKYARIFRFGKTTKAMYSICGNCGRYHGFDSVKDYKGLEKAVFQLDAERKEREAAKSKKNGANVGGKIK